MIYYINATVHGTIRLYTNAYLDDNQKYTLNILCCWGGADKIGKNYVSWEFDPVMLSVLPQIMRRFGVSETQTYDWIK